jgi:ribonuclease-3
LVSSEGPSHKKDFIINVLVGDEIVGIGNGKNKKAAEQNASKDALQKLGIVDF